jgi:periplasmic divalent cation tolerance protein
MARKEETAVGATVHRQRARRSGDTGDAVHHSSPARHRARRPARRYISAPASMPTMTQPPSAATDAVVVLTTVASAEEAVALVRSLLDRRLVACGTLLPGARSLYRWEGKIADEEEVVVMLKTRASRVDSLRTAFGELHPYKVPELLALPVAAGAEKYLGWIAAETALALA